MNRFFPLLAALLLASSAVCAEQIFVLFDGSCGDRVRYEQSIAKQPRSDYYAYSFAFQNGDRLILETGTEGATVQNYLPQGYVYCGDARLTPRLAERVNGGEDQVFILLPAGNEQFLIQPVVMAALLQQRGEVFSYFSPLTGFSFDQRNGIIGENLSVNNPDAKVYFEGRETSPCSGVFLFRQLKPQASYPVIDYRVAPEFGVFERRLGSDGISTTGGVIVAREINGVAVADHLRSVCGGNRLAGSPTAGQPTAYGNQQPAPAPLTVPVVPRPTSPTPQPESVAYGQASRTAAPAATGPRTVTHTVARGETLYAVSRKYQTTVESIKAANGLTGNTLFPGQQLAVTTNVTLPSAPVADNGGASAPQAVTLNPTVPTVPYNAGSVANSNPGAAQPTPYGSAPSAAPAAYGQQTRGGQAAVYGEDTHIVQPGETVASIALRYGYTSAKFREMNELGANEIVRIGQQLRTTNCNCPAAPAATAQPAAYGQAPAAPAPQAYGQPQPAAAPQAYGQATQLNPAPSPAPAPTYRTPEGYQPPGPSPVPAATTPKAPQPTTITNSPNFGQVVPDAAAPPTATMGQLERQTAPPAPRTTPTNPATYGSSPAPAPAPTAYGAPQPVPNAYGTPVGATAPANPAPAAPERAFHLVQEGESLFSIARRYGLTVDQLRALNRLDNGSVIVPFQKLYVN